VTFATEDDVAASMATTTGAMSAPEWSDFFSMPLPQKQACAQLYKGAIFDAGGPSAWDAALGILGTAATIFGEASGIAGAYQVFRALV
jgi:hypothetical protein